MRSASFSQNLRPSSRFSWPSSSPCTRVRPDGRPDRLGPDTSRPRTPSGDDRPARRDLGESKLTTKTKLRHSQTLVLLSATGFPLRSASSSEAILARTSRTARSRSSRRFRLASRRRRRRSSCRGCRVTILFPAVFSTCSCCSFRQLRGSNTRLWPSDSLWLSTCSSAVPDIVVVLYCSSTQTLRLPRDQKSYL